MGSGSDQNGSLFRFPAKALGHVLFDNTHAFGACQPSLSRIQEVPLSWERLDPVFDHFLACATVPTKLRKVSFLRFSFSITFGMLF